MIDLLSLLKSTNAYKIIKNDKQQGRLSHAYLIVCADKDNLKGYMTGIAKLLFCNDEEPCQKCRNCLSIEQGVYPDAEFFPKGEKGVLSEDVNELVKNTYIKPYESDKRAFFVCDAQTMNLSSQNKLLKTLEEPPKNVYIFLGATSEFSLRVLTSTKTTDFGFSATISISPYPVVKFCLTII